MNASEREAIFDKIRFPLAIFLSSAVLLGYFYLAGPREQPLPPKRESTPQPQVSTQEEKTELPTTIHQKSPSLEEKFYTLTNKTLNLTFSTIHAAVCKAELKLFSHRDGSLTKSKDLEIGGNKAFRTGTLSLDKDKGSPLSFKLVEKTSNSITFQGEMKTARGPIQIVKHYLLEGYKLKLNLKLVNPQQQPVLDRFLLFNGSGLGEKLEERNKTAFDLIKLTYNEEDDIHNALKESFFSKEKNAAQIIQPSKWIAIDDRFYTRLLKPAEPKHSAVFWKTFDLEGTNYVHAYEIKVNLPGQGAQQELFEIYYLPKSRGVIQSLFSEKGEDLNKIFDNNLLMKILINLLYTVMIWIDTWVLDFGIAIMIMTLLVKLVTFPLTHKSYVSMQKMQRLNPKVAEIRKKNKKQPQKANQEIMALYRKEKVNPAMGCFPMLIPIPIFFALYLLFQNMIELDGAEFLWIENLAHADHFWRFDQKLPLLGEYFNLLPPLMAGSQFLQSVLTPQANTGNEMAEVQLKMMRYVFPLVFLFICWPLPAALVLYWLVQNILTIFQTLLTQRKAEKKLA